MAAASLPKMDYSRFSKHGEIMLAAGVVIILFVMLVPLPTFFLDIMLCVSISIALLVLITTMFMTSPLEFTIFPSLLLVTTLLRLSLNVAATRLILLNGDMGVDAAGSVIGTEFVSSSTAPEVQAFVKAFKKKYPEEKEVTLFEAGAYDALHVAVAAAKKGGTDRAGILKGFQEITDVPSVVYGTLSFDKDTRRPASPQLTPTVLKDGAWIAIEG